MTLGQAAEYYSENEPRGEFVLVLEGKTDGDDSGMSLEEALEQVKALVEHGEKPTDACKAVAKETGYRKSELYAAFCED